MGKKELSDFIFSSLYESIGLFFQGHQASCIEEEEHHHHNENCLQKSSLLRLLCTVNAWIKERSS